MSAPHDPGLAAPARLRSRAHLFIDVQHGLCNRLRAMASAAAIAEATDRQLVVVWRPDAHCAARLSDVLRYPGPVLEDAAADLFRERAAYVHNDMEIEPGSRHGAPILAAGDKGGDVFIRSAYALTGPFASLAREQAFLHSLTPAAEVLDLVAEVPHPSDVAVHIRMGTGPAFDHLPYEAPENWPPERHAELVMWRQKSDVGRFAARLETLFDQGAQSAFVAADLAATYAALQERFGARIRFLPRDRFDRSARQLQYALADLMLLTAAPRLLASHWSSFSDMAQRLARQFRPVEKSGIDF
ncbi:hypothetical protein [Pseudorhodobacter sp. MZDSW-24AT]|uniref:hypothetical protein n=1 Tax=Pseudorhodobacter sp. MZDSW-24AT TaxID=2052957 RepID=UPI000C1E627E|nr:hypothetical protein [Pseudorhodobacter sp. MZDSW-24AT]PJF11311.1 hypothetical protein CUR21_01590 [Pseudorhodobacter sp. MZDSW-24AT]